jgi:adenylate cyclase
VRAAELDGLAFAFRARTLAVVVVSVWLVLIVPWPREAYYLGLAAAFFVLGFVPYRLRHSPYAIPIKLAFTLLDVALVTFAILVPPPEVFGTSWPVQTRLRGQEFLYLLLLLAEAALTYSPLRVLWTGAAILAIWSLGFELIYRLPDTSRFLDAVRDGPLTSTEVLRIALEPTFVALTPWRTQLIATALFTLILTLAVWRGRRTLLAQVQAEVVRADLARYVSPDVADALAKRASQGTSQGFGEPATRVVAILYADLVGFTAATEALTPERTFALLRSFQERCCRVVFAHGGTLDKYLGDGFMATFGGLEDQGDAPARAVACALALQDEIARWNAKRARRGAPSVALSVGVHCGPVVAGNLGADRRVEFTVVGDTVNVASRLEEATREHGAAVLVSESCLACAPEAVAARFGRTLELTPRGRRKPLRVRVLERI